MSSSRSVRTLVIIPLLMLACILFNTVGVTEATQANSTVSPTPKTTQPQTVTKNAVSNTSAAAVVAIPTNITLAATPAAVQLKTQSVFSGTLTATDTSTTPSGPTTPVASEVVQIQTYTATNTWTVVASTTTDTAGAFSVPVTIAQTSAQFRAVFVGDSTYATSTSPAIVVTAFKAATVIFNTGPSQVKAETLTSYSVHFEVKDSRVSTNPAVVGAAVDIYSQDVYGGADWVKFDTLVTNSAGNVSWRAKVSTPTNWKIVGHSTDTTLAVNWGPYRPKVIPIGKVITLPASAPKPKALAPQGGAVGAGANADVSSISNTMWNDMTGKSWHSGCPVGRSQLSVLRVNYWGFDGYRHRGVLVYRSSHKSEYVSAFTKLYNDRIPLHGMYPVDKFGYSSRTHGGDDYDSMEHDNTSAFNCRWVDGNPGTLSPHSYGTAVDINPYENPYHSAQGWTPNYWWRNHNIGSYTWRSGSDAVVQDMRQAGFHWTYGNEDSQHFDT